MRQHDLVQSGRFQLTTTVRIIFAGLKMSHTYKDIAYVSGISSGLVSKILNRDHIPTLETLCIIHDHLKIDYEIKIKSVKGVRMTTVNGVKARDFIVSKGLQNVKDRIHFNRVAQHLEGAV